MVADAVAFGCDPSNEFGMPFGARTDHKKGRPGAMRREDVEQPGREDRIRTIIERQRDNGLLGYDTSQHSGNDRHQSFVLRFWE
jgi:hypothetical protein